MDQPDLGKKIAELRKAKGLTQEELVEKCNLNVRTLQRIESGEVIPRSYTIKTIFTALDYTGYDSSEMTPEEFGNTGFLLSSWLEQVYRSVVDLLNLKTNTMKKISILSLVMLLVVSLTFNLNVHSQSVPLNPLLGKWKLVETKKAEFNRIDSTFYDVIVKIDNSSTRILEFTTDLGFESRTLQNDVYNGGVYSVLNDSTFVTVHYTLNGKLAAISNLYNFKIQKDTLHFKGFYMDRVRGLGEHFFVEKGVDEKWVKVVKLRSQGFAGVVRRGSLDTYYRFSM